MAWDCVLATGRSFKLHQPAQSRLLHLSLHGGGRHSITGPALKARKYLLAHLDGNRDDLECQWILNISAMALGDYPDGIPERFVIPVPTNGSGNAIERFVDVAPELGVDTFNLCGAVITEDSDNDGFIDIVTSTDDPGGPITMYRNKGNGSFEDVSDSSGLNDQLGGLNCIAADYDNDRDMDIIGAVVLACLLSESSSIGYCLS